MCMYFFGIDISKQKHDCYIISATDQSVVAKFTFRNDIESFQHLVSSLNSLTNLNNIRTDFESVAYYALNLELFLEKAHHSFMEVNPSLISEFKKSTSLKRTKPIPSTANPLPVS